MAKKILKELKANANNRKGDLEEICQEGFSNHLQIFSIIVIVYSGNYHDEYDSNKQRDLQIYPLVVIL